MKLNDEEKVLSVRIEQINGEVPMLLTKGQITYEISPDSYEYKAIVDERVVESWQKINIRRIHKQLFNELVHRIQILSHDPQDHYYSETRFVINVCYLKHVDLYYFKGTIEEKDSLLASILNRIVGVNKHFNPIFRSSPIDDEKLLTIDASKIQMFLMTTMLNDIHTLNDEFYILINDKMLYTPYINNNIDSEEKCKKIIKDFDKINFEALSDVKINDVTFTMIGIGHNRYLFINNDTSFKYVYRFLRENEGEASEEFYKFLLRETNVPTNVICK